MSGRTSATRQERYSLASNLPAKWRPSFKRRQRSPPSRRTRSCTVPARWKLLAHRSRWGRRGIPRLEAARVNIGHVELERTTSATESNRHVTLARAVLRTDSPERLPKVGFGTHTLAWSASLP